MISDRAAKCVWDARRTAERIRWFTAGYDFKTYMTAERLHEAVALRSWKNTLVDSPRRILKGALRRVASRVGHG